jgi:protein-tyrosine phosphatase
MSGSSGTASVLVVCVGNIRRSPAAATLLRHGTPKATGLAGSGVTVASAGVTARAGAPMDPLIAEQLARRGVKVDDHAARTLTTEQIEQADLVLTAERAQRSAVVRLVPAAVRKTFTVRELAALATLVGRASLADATDPSARVRRLVELAPLERSRRVVSRLSVDDLIDPRHGSARAAHRLVGEIDATVGTILSLLEPEPVLSIVAAPAESDRVVPMTSRVVG